jgi:hypothetical protein
MAAFKLNLKIDQGASFARLVTWKTGDPAVATVPVDLTGCTARMQVRASVNSPTVLLSLTTENGGIVLGGTAGTVELCILTAEQTAALTWARGVYDLEIVYNPDNVRRLLHGTVTVSREVTR